MGVVGGVSPIDPGPPPTTPFDEFLQQVATECLFRWGLVPSVNHGLRWRFYYLTPQKTTWKAVGDTLREARADTVRKYVSGMAKPSGKQLGDILEITLLRYLNHRLSSADLPLLLRGSGPGDCDLHLLIDGAHRLCVNAKLLLERRPSWTVKVLPEFERCSQDAYVALWSPEQGLQLFHAQSATLTTASAEELSVDQLITRIQEVRSPSTETMVVN